MTTRPMPSWRPATRSPCSSFRPPRCGRYCLPSRATGYSEHGMKPIWDVLVPFSDYAFNRAHASCYGMVGYWTAFLKANYPTEYMAALLTSVAGDKDKSALYLSECRRMGIKVLPPDVNASTAYFTPVDTHIRFGMAAVRNVGAALVASILATRPATGTL